MSGLLIVTINIRINLLWEDHFSTADCYYSLHSLGYTQYKMDDLTSALPSHQRALDIRRKLGSIQ